jgi:hypothetical protein
MVTLFSGHSNYGRVSVLQFKRPLPARNIVLNYHKANAVAVVSISQKHKINRQRYNAVHIGHVKQCRWRHQMPGGVCSSSVEKNLYYFKTRVQTFLAKCG